jgi:excisionase family DNA binding protein
MRKFVENYLQWRLVHYAAVTHTAPTMPPSSVEKSFCTTKEAALLLGVSVGTVQLWAESGLLQAWKTAGGHRRVIRESVEKLLRKAPPLAPQLAAPPALAEPLAARRLRVLVVEDDASLLRLYQARIAAWPMAPLCVVTDNAFSALLTMGHTPVDLLITDLHMPGIDGFVMLRSLQKAPEAAQTHVVVVSGLDAPEIEAQGGLPAGIELLPKPVPFDRLLQIATELVQARQLHGLGSR